MRTAAALAAFALLFVPAAARAAAPALRAAAATDVQGVSALLGGEVDPGGLATTYAFQYVDEAGFEASGFSQAIGTPTSMAGSGTGYRQARAAITGLRPDTVYRFRLTAQNSAGDTEGEPEAFVTTHGFGFLPGAAGFESIVRAEGGAPDTLSGSHPNSLTIGVGFNLAGEFENQPGVRFPDGDPRELHFELPPGLILNPVAVAECPVDLFNTSRSSGFEDSRSGEDCPDASQVGTVDVHTSFGGATTRRFGLFDLDPAPGLPAQLGFAPFGTPVAFGVQIRPGSNGQYAFTLDSSGFPQAFDLRRLDLTLWGTPWEAVHDGERGDCLNEAEPEFPWAKCSVGPPRQKERHAYLTMPTDCAGPLAFTARASSWQQPATVSRSYPSGSDGQPVVPDGCETLLFKPTAFGQLTDRKASSSSGFVFDLIDTDEGLTKPGDRVRSQARKASVTLPEGVTVNPSLGVGLGACTPGQYAAETALSPQGSGCPNDAKIGSFTVHTPLFEKALEGAIYLAQPDDAATPLAGAENPFDSLLAVYLVAKSNLRGILVKVAGELMPDPATGRLTGSFEGLPQLPYTALEVHFRTGQRAPLITPATCGRATTRIELTPWAVGPASTVSSTDSQIATGVGGGACPTDVAPRFAPKATAGSINSNVGSYTPFYLHLTRSDDEQEITSYSAVLPRGITGRLAGIPFCPDEAIVAARTRTGVAENANPSCPVASQIGRTLSGYGIGPALAYSSGRIFLAGPYHGSPLSIVTVDAATVGPFDLGTIVIRSAFDVDPRTAQLRIDSRGSDPIPHILRGIPLHLRDVRVFIDRPNFTRNPTSCEPSQVASTLTGSGARFGDSSDDSSVTVLNHFQLLNCRTLGFRPRLGLRLRGGSKRGDYPALRAVFAARAGDANLKRIAVTMPHSEFLAQNHIRSVCTQVQFAADSCPAGSIYGHAVAYTPLFDAPLRGPVYLRSSSHRLPDLVASLHSGAVHIVLEGKISPARSGIRVFFSELPDAPLNRFTMTLKGGGRGLLVNSTNLCAAPPIATVKALGQNNIGSIFTTELRGQCERKRHSHHKRSALR
jgi:hypothetical protein